MGFFGGRKRRNTDKKTGFLGIRKKTKPKVPFLSAGEVKNLINGHQPIFDSLKKREEFRLLPELRGKTREEIFKLPNKALEDLAGKAKAQSILIKSTVKNNRKNLSKKEIIFLNSLAALYGAEAAFLYKSSRK